MGKSAEPPELETIGCSLSAEGFQDRFARWWATVESKKTVLVLTHNDADGLCSAAILQRRLGAERELHVRILGRGETPWDRAVVAEIEQQEPAGLIVTDLGIRPHSISPEIPTIFIDHHQPRGSPRDAVAISGYGMDPIPTSGLLSFWCTEAWDKQNELWLAAISIIGDMGEESRFPEFEAARKKYGVTALRKATSLINALRRSSSTDTTAAYRLLMKARHPTEVLSGVYPETRVMVEAKAEVAKELERAKRVGPRIKDNVAIIMLDSPCQIHPVVAQLWKSRLNKNIVLVANRGYRPGWVHFSVRSATGVDLINFLKERAPSSADENYGSGHVQATGGALRPEGWNEFVRSLGFGPEAMLEV